MANNKKIRGITIELGADASGVLDAISEVNREISSTSKDLKDVDKLLKLDPGNMELLSQKTQYLQEQIGNATEKLDLLKEAQKDMEDNGVDENSEQYRALQREIIATEQEIEKLKETTGSGSASLAKVSQVTGEWGDKAENAGKKLMPVTLAITALGTGAVKTASDFDSSMSQVQATMGITADSMSTVDGQSVNTMDALRGLAKEMGANTAFSASECADAINYLALAGYDTQEMFDTLPTVLNLAAAGNLDLASASDMVTDAMSALGLETSDADTMVDQMAKTASTTNTSVGQLGEAMLSIGGTAKDLSGGTAELSTALGILANNGLKGAEGGTHLRNTILALQSPTDKARAAMDELGLQVYDTEGNMRPLNDILGDLNESMDGMSQEERNDIITKIFNKTDLSAVNALLANTGTKWDSLQTSITESGGAAQQMADTQLDNLGGQLTLLKSAVEGLAISVGETLMPIIRDVVGVIQSIVDWLNSLDEGTRTTIITVAAIIAAIGPLLVIGGKVLKGISSITSALSSIGTVATGPIGLVIAAVGAAAAGMAILTTALSNAYKEASPFTESLEAVKEANEELKSSIDSTKSAYEDSSTAAEANASAADYLMGRLEDLMGSYDGTAEKQSEIEATVSALNGTVQDLGLEWDSVTNSLNKTNDEIYANIEAMRAQAQVAALQDLYTESLKQQYQAQQTVQEAAQNLTGVMERYGLTLEDVQKWSQGGIAAEAEMTAKMLAAGVEVWNVSNATDELSQALVGYVDATNNANEVTENVEYAESKLGEAMTAAAEATSNASQEVETNIANMAGTISDYLNDAIMAAEDAGIGIPQKLIDGILAGKIKEEDAVKQMNSIVQFQDAIKTAGVDGVKVSQSFIDSWLSGEYELEQANTYYNSFVDFNDALATAEAEGKEITPTFVNELLDSHGLAEVVSAANTVGDAAVPQVPEEEIKAEAQETNQALADELENSSYVAENSAKEVAGDVADQFSDMPDEVGGYGTSAGEKLDSGFGSNSGSISNTIDDIWDLYYNTLGKTLPGKMWEWGYDAGGSYKRGLEERIDSISNKINEIPTSISNAGQSMYNAGYNAGSNGGSGLYYGLYAWWNPIMNLVYSMAQAVANTMRYALQIHSPSKVMERIGEYTGEGMAIGLRESAADIHKEMDSIADYLVGSTEGINALNSSVKQANAVAIQTQQNQSEIGGIVSLLSQYLPHLADQQNIVLDDGTLAGHMAPAINNALEQINIRAQRG